MFFPCMHACMHDCQAALENAFLTVHGNKITQSKLLHSYYDVGLTSGGTDVSKCRFFRN